MTDEQLHLDEPLTEAELAPIMKWYEDEVHVMRALRELQRLKRSAAETTAKCAKPDVHHPACNCLERERIRAALPKLEYSEHCGCCQRNKITVEVFRKRSSEEPSENMTSQQHAARNALQGCTCGSDGNLHHFGCQFRREGDDGKGAVKASGELPLCDCDPDFGCKEYDPKIFRCCQQEMERRAAQEDAP